MNWIKSWPTWVFCVSAGVLWVLPRLPHYHVDLPYIYDLGGLALVAWYIGLGFLSLGGYILMIEGLNVPVRRLKRSYALLVGGSAFMLAGGFFWLYLILLRMSVAIS